MTNIAKSFRVYNLVPMYQRGRGAKQESTVLLRLPLCKRNEASCSLHGWADLAVYGIDNLGYHYTLYIPM